MRYLLDTNVISELIVRKPDKRIVQWLDSLDPNSVYLSVITIGEIRKGIEKLPDSVRKDHLRAWLADDLLVRFSGRILAVDIDTMLTWGELTGRLERQGKKMSAMDSLVAAIAVSCDLCLVTRNEHHFQDTGAMLLNPWQLQ